METIIFLSDLFVDEKRVKTELIARAGETHIQNICNTTSLNSDEKKEALRRLVGNSYL